MPTTSPLKPNRKFSIGSFLFLLHFLFLSGCGGHAVIKSSEKNSNYDTKISNLLVVIDESHLGRAFLRNRKDVPFSAHIDADVESSAEERIAARNARVDDQVAEQKKLSDSLSVPMTALKESLVSAFSAQGVGVEVQVVNIIRDRLLIEKTSKKYAQQQILLLNTAAFQTSQATLYGKPYGPRHWTGRVSWNAKLLDGGKTANSEGKPVWGAKTDFFLFGPAQCSHDAFKACSDRFVATLIQQMRTEGLLAENKK